MPYVDGPCSWLSLAASPDASRSVLAPGPTTSENPTATGFVELAGLSRHDTFLGREQFHLRHDFREGVMRHLAERASPDERKSPAPHNDPQVEFFQSSKVFSLTEDRPPACDS